MVCFSLILSKNSKKDLDYAYSCFKCEEELLMHYFDFFKDTPSILGIKYKDESGEYVNYWFGLQAPISHYANLNPEKMPSEEADALVGRGYTNLIILKSGHAIIQDDSNKHVTELVRNILAEESDLEAPKVLKKTP